MHINLNHLRAFYLAAREKSITKAAEALYVTQPAVTMQIKSFEKNLDIQLFRKYGKELQLTDAGKALFGYAERIFLIVGELEHALKSWGDLNRGSLLYKPEVELEAKMGLLIPFDVEEGPILVQTDIVYPKETDLSPPAQDFLRLIEPQREIEGR